MSQEFGGQASTTYEVGLHVSEYPPHYVERVANTQDNQGRFQAPDHCLSCSSYWKSRLPNPTHTGAAHTAIAGVKLGDEVIAIDGEDITQVT